MSAEGPVGATSAQLSIAAKKHGAGHGGEILGDLFVRNLMQTIASITEMQISPPIDLGSMCGTLTTLEIKSVVLPFNAIEGLHFVENWNEIYGEQYGSISPDTGLAEGHERDGGVGMAAAG